MKTQQSLNQASPMKRFLTLAVMTLFLGLFVAEAQASSLTTIINNFRSQGYTAEDVRKAMKQYNVTAQDLMNAGYTVDDLADAGFTASELKSAGVTVQELKDAGFTPQDLTDAGFTVQDMRNAGYTVGDLKDAGYSLRDLTESGFSVQELRSQGVSTAEFKSSGFSAAELKSAGVSDRELYLGGYTAAELKATGASASDLRTAGISANDLKSAGYSDGDLKNAGFSAYDLRRAGSSYADLKNAGFTAQELSSAGASPQDLKTLGYSYQEMQQAGLNASQLKSAGASASELKSAGYNASELRNAGMSAQELKEAGFSNLELHQASFSTADLKNAGLSAEELKSLGVSLRDLQNVGFSTEELLAAGFTAQELQEQGASLQDLIAQGISIEELLSSGQATPQDLLNAGVELQALRSAGVSDAELKAAGASIADLKAAGASINELIAAGATVNELRNAGFSTQELVSAGQSVEGLLQSGVSVSDLQKAGVSTSELVNAGASPDALIAAGVSIEELLAAGVPPELISEGRSTRELLESGVSVSTLLAQGKSVEDLFNSGASVEDLAQAGASATDLKNAGASVGDMVSGGVKAADLKEAGVTAEELKLNGVSNTDLVTAGYNPQDLIQAGLSTQDMIAAGVDVGDLKEIGISNRALYDAGASVAQLKEAGVNLEDLIKLGANDNDLRQAGFTPKQISDKREEIADNEKKDDKGIDDLIESELIAQILNDGKACQESSSNNSNANQCRSQGRTWNCDMNVCYTDEYRSEMITKASNCLETQSGAERQNACINGVKNEAVRDVASGALCDNTSNEAISCAASGRIYNCNVGQCLTIAQNERLTSQVEKCYQGQDADERLQCMEQTKVNVAIDLLTNCDAQSSPEAVMCRRDGTKSFNCLANSCLDKSFNDSISERTEACIREGGENQEACLEDIKGDVVRHIASGESCDQTTPKAKECQADGKVYNCNVGYCLTESQNDELADRTVACELESKNSQEKEQCIADLKKEAITKVASGEMCDQKTNEAMMCTAQGKIWNCNVDACLSVEENILLTDQIVSCELETQTPREKDQCYKDMKEGVIRHIASGGNCDPSDAEAKACSAEGKVWNCNVNFCLTEAQNDVLADEIVKCQLLESTSQVNLCMAGLEDRAIDFLMRACDISNNPEAQRCGERGRVWNCQVNMCLSEEDHMRLVNAVKNCNAKPTKEEQQECHAELEDFAKMAENGEGLDSDKIKMPNNPSKIIHGGAAALGLAAGTQGCKSGYVVAAAGAYAVVNEMNTDKSTKSAMDALRERVKAMEERVKKEDASFELQVEVFDFSLQAIDEGIAIARMKDNGYGMVLGMYGVALGLTAVEMAMWWNPSMVVCGAMNVGASVGGMATVGLIKGAINKGIADLQKQRAHIQNIRDRFLHHFGGHGALATDRNRKGPDGGDYQPGEQSPTTITMNPVAQRQRSASQAPERPTAASQARSCLSNTKKPDANCECAKNNSCFQMDNLTSGIPQDNFDANMRNMVSGLSTDSMVNDANRVLRGEINSGDLNQGAINSRNQRILAHVDGMKDQINKGLAQNNKPPMPPQNEETAMAFIDSLVSPQLLAQRQMQAGDQDLTSIISEGAGLDDISEQIRELASQTDLPPGAGIMPSFNFAPFEFDGADSLTLKNQTRDEMAFDIGSDDHLMLGSNTTGKTYDYSSIGSQVHRDPDQNIFNIISNRYNVLRLSNRFGGTVRLQD